MKRILSLDGGGAKGPMQLQALAVLEERTGKRVFELFDLIIGTSVGAINASMLATGKYSAVELLEVMRTEMPKVFKRHKTRYGKYSKETLEKKYAEMFGQFAVMGDAKTKLVITSYEDTEARMHFFKSWEDNDSYLGLFQAVDRSSAAPMYFGPVVDSCRELVWLDGGVSMFNNPSLYSFVESTLLGWDSEEVRCYSVGCGYTENKRSFKDATKRGWISQLMNWWRLKKGGLARATASTVICHGLKALVHLEWWKFNRFDTVIPAKLDAMDKTKYFKEYCEYGKLIGNKLSDNYIKYV